MRTACAVHWLTQMSPLRRQFACVGLLAILATWGVSARGADPPASSGFMLGASVDYLAPILSSAVTPGPGVGVHVGYRWRLLYFGAAYEHGFLAGAGQGGHDGTPWDTTGASTDYVGIDIDTNSAPDAVVSFVTHFSAGYRVLSITSTCCFSSVPTTSLDAGPELLLVGLGFQINAGGWLRPQPEVSIALGPASMGSAGITAFFDLGAPRG